MRLAPQRHWTPRYVFDRLHLAYNQRRHPDLPWWPEEFTALFDDLLCPTDVCLEWGSGRSTAWLGARVGSLLSIEHNGEWFTKVQADLAAQSGDVATLRLLSPEPNDRPEESPYVRVIDEFEDGSLDVCLVDGVNRAACATVALPKIAKGGFIVVDDAHRYIDHPTRSPHSPYGKRDYPPEWAGFAAEIASWRRIWTTDGVTDTAMWIRPDAPR